MRLALAPINPTVGDLAGNAERVEAAAHQAWLAGADLVVFPELALTGYPPRDLLWQQGFVLAAGALAKGRLADATNRWPGLTLVLGTPLPLDPDARRQSNALLAYRDGRLIEFYDKRLLPTYDVFDESRYFTPGSRPAWINAGGVRVGLTICEDLWRGLDVGYDHRYLDQRDPVADLCAPSDPDARPAQLIINPSASPFVLGKTARHRAILAHHAKARGIFVAAVNQLGGNDELVFDGHTAVYAPGGTPLAAGPAFADDLLVVDLPIGRPGPNPLAPAASAGPLARSPGASAASDTAPAATDAPDEELLFRALVLGTRDYARKTGFQSCVLGLSGGIDSAVVAVLAAAAFGPERVVGVSMPSRYSSTGSRTDAHALAEALHLRIIDLPIEDAFNTFERTLAEPFAGTPPGIAEENLQSRIRGTLLMALSNKFNHLLLTTGNKSELAVGYCTLYGDMNGGLAVISDVGKIMVYRLARWMNQHWPSLGIPGLAGPPIPEASLTKAPSAELRPNQTDQDSLPPYHILDEIIERFVERREDAATIIAGSGFDEPTVRRVIRLITLSEYKRKQAAIGLKVTSVAFGSGRRFPIAQGWNG